MFRTTTECFMPDELFKGNYYEIFRVTGILFLLPVLCVPNCIKSVEDLLLGNLLRRLFFLGIALGSEHVYAYKGCCVKLTSRSTFFVKSYQIRVFLPSHLMLIDDVVEDGARLPRKTYYFVT